ncbi:CBS domain-containing protein [Polaromonas sp. P2-4]|nr:CBS domain-containing protein [Polaromonas sp. P2-4]
MERIGMFSTTDLRDALLLAVPPHELAVREVTQFNLISLSPDAELFDALLAMIRHRVHRVLVREGDAILGVLSQQDLMSLVSKHSHLIALQVDRATSIDELKTAALQMDGLIAAAAQRWRQDRTHFQSGGRTQSPDSCATVVLCGARGTGPQQLPDRHGQ